MTLKSTWSIGSDDENSRGSFLSDYDSEFDLSPSVVTKLSIDQDEPPMTRSRAKAVGKLMINTPSVLKESGRSTVRQSIDSMTEMTSAFTNSILFPKEEVSNNHLPISPIDGVNKLSDWFENCTLDENKFRKNYLWSNCETNNHSNRPILSSSTNSTFNSNLFSISQTSSTSSFGQQPVQLWSHFRFAASTIRNNFWTEQSYSTPSNLTLSSSPPQIVPSLFSKTSTVSSNKEDLLIHRSSSKICFTLFIFIIGLVLGYFLTNTFPPNLICHWLFILKQTSIKISLKYFHLFSNYLQIILQYISSNIFFVLV